jgi:hypothetical protein
MWARMIVAPWWVRWLVNAATFAAWLILVCALLIPSFFGGLGWAFGVLSVLGFSLLATLLLTVTNRPVAHRYKAAVAGVDATQRAEAVKALRRGEIPADPKVLAAAIRVGTLSLTYQRRASRLQKSAKWWLPALWLVVVALMFFTNGIRQALIWTVVGALLLGRREVLRRRGRRLPGNLELLRSAAGSEAAPADEGVAATPPQRFWVSMLIAIVGGVGIGAAFYVSERPTPDCRTANEAVAYIHDHPDMLNWPLITIGGPGVDKYQDWSNRLQDYPRRVSAPDLAAHLRHIADLSTRAVSLVREARPDPPNSLSPDDTSHLQYEYHEVIGPLIDEDTAVATACRRHR